MRPCDAFGVLGLEPRFDLSLAELRAAWMRRAAAAHPDADGAVEQSAQVNDAMRVLSSPIERAQALMELRGAPAVDGRAMPQAFLLEMMELRERADACVGDAGAVAGLRDEALARRGEAIAAIAAAFAGAADGPLSSECASRIAEQINVVRAFDRMVEQLDREAGGQGAMP